MYARDLFVFVILFCDVFGRLTKKPQNALALRNQKTQLNCSTDGAKGNLIEWTYDHVHIVWPPCVSQDRKSFLASSPDPATDCNVQAVSSDPGDISGAYVCNDRTQKAIAMIVWLDPASDCFVESVDTDGRGATLGCSLRYSWQSRAMQFHVVPTITVALSWDGSPTPARHISHPQDDQNPTSRLESTVHVSISSPHDVTRHTCTVTFTFSEGSSPLHQYANNTLSWTCSVKEGNKVADEAGDQKIAPHLLAPDDTQNVVGKPERAETPFAAPLERDQRADELKLVKDQSFRRVGWLIPLMFVFGVVVVVFLAYNKLFGRRRYPRNNVGGYGFGALAVPLLLILFIGFLVPVYSLSSDLAHHSH